MLRPELCALELAEVRALQRPGGSRVQLSRRFTSSPWAATVYPYRRFDLAHIALGSLLGYIDFRWLTYGWRGRSDFENPSCVALTDGVTDIDRQRRRVRHRAFHVMHLV